MQRDAWCLRLTNQQTLAVAQQQVVEYLTNVSACLVPKSNPECNQVILWRDRVLPVWGTNSSSEYSAIELHSHILVISYLDNAMVGDDKPQLLALSLSMAPVLLSVCDEDQCQPSPAQSDFWKTSILACFQYQNSPVPVINFFRLRPIN